MIQPQIYLSSQNISAQIRPYLKRVNYTETIEGESDTAEIVLADNLQTLLKGYQPQRGSEFQIELTDGGKTLTTGKMELDEVSYRSNPSEFTLKLNSIPNSAKARGVNKNRSWEECRLSEIAADIAGGAGLSLFYDTSTDPDVKRAEQTDESDLSFLKRLCRDNALDIKVHDRKLIIFESVKYENRDAVGVFRYNDARLLNFSARAKSTQIYGGANVFYQSNGVADWLWSFLGGQELFSGAAEVALTGLSNGAGDNILNINERVNSQGEADRLANARLHDANKKEFTIDIKLVGNFEYRAGNTLELADFGLFAGKFLISKVSHDISNGYTVQINAYKVQNV